MKKTILAFYFGILIVLGITSPDANACDWQNIQTDQFSYEGCLSDGDFVPSISYTATTWAFSAISCSPGGDPNSCSGGPSGNCVYTSIFYECR